jgi:hypothetical protein
VHISLAFRCLPEVVCDRQKLSGWPEQRASVSDSRGSSVKMKEIVIIELFKKVIGNWINFGYTENLKYLIRIHELL